MARKNKKELVEKVAEETKVEVADLDRLPVEAIEKLDAIVPDQELPSDEVSESQPTEVCGAGTICESETVRPTSERVRLKGHHPITKEPVYL
jgi:uncharacterized protein YfeS